MKEGFDAENIVRFKKKPERVMLPVLESSAVPSHVPAPEPEKKITLSEAVPIARDVVKKYGDKQELFNTFLKEYSKNTSLESIEEFNALLDRNKEMIAAWKTEELRALLQSYFKNPEETFKVHVFCAAEEFVRRLPKKEE